MVAIITLYKESNEGEGLILKNNYVKELMEYDLKEFLSDYTNSKEDLEYHHSSIKESIKFRSYSNIIEGRNSNGDITHLRIIK